MKPYHSYLRKGREMTEKKSPSLMKTVLTNLAHDLEKYEERDYLYEFMMTMATGRVPTLYRAVHILAVGSKFLRNVTTERESKGRS
jgi:hypothetical protein